MTKTRKLKTNKCKRNRQASATTKLKPKVQSKLTSNSKPKTYATVNPNPHLKHKPSKSVNTKYVRKALNKHSSRVVKHQHKQLNQIHNQPCKQKPNTSATNIKNHQQPKFTTLQPK